jgi:hypothetical protein
MTSTTTTLTSSSARGPETTDPHLLALLHRYEPTRGSYFARSAPHTQIKRSRGARSGRVRAGYRPL